MSKQVLRQGQLITTYGPGSMLDLPDEAVIVAGLEHWSYSQEQPIRVDEPRLLAKVQNALGRQDLHLQQPPVSRDQAVGQGPNVTVWKFPNWFVSQHVVSTPRGFRRRRLLSHLALDGGKHRDADNKKHSVVPVRFVRACERGHAGDIDWKAFVHGATDSACVRDLWMEERGTSGDLDEVWIACDCGAERAMSQAARTALEALGRCNGARPWLGAGTRERCGLINRMLIRSASNAYFPQLLTVISIPDRRSALDEVVRRNWESGLKLVADAAGLTLVKQLGPIAVALQGLSDDQVLASIQRVRGGANDLNRSVKEVEFEALSSVDGESGADVPEGAFYARALPESQWGAAWLKGLQRVVLVHRLQEVVAQIGFTRFEAQGADINGDLDLDVERATLAIDANWIPAIINRGEGIFMQFDTAAVNAWMQRPAVIQRAAQLQQSFQHWRDAHPHARREFPGIAYYMLHSLSHLLMTAISLECGYPASSLRERVYALPALGMYGILILTGASDAEGTLGGLVLAGRDIRRHFRRALESGMLCSNDPVCAGHGESRYDGLELVGAACHGCLLVSETSCEQRNDFLDRALMVPTVSAQGAEFFAL